MENLDPVLGVLNEFQKLETDQPDFCLKYETMATKPHLFRNNKANGAVAELHTSAHCACKPGTEQRQQTSHFPDVTLQTLHLMRSQWHMKQVASPSRLCMQFFFSLLLSGVLRATQEEEVENLHCE